MTQHSIQMVYLVGLGAIGTKYGSKIHDLNPKLINVIAAGDRRQRLERSNIRVNGKPYVFKFAEPGEAHPPADLILVAVKNHQLEQAIKDIKAFVGPDTIVMSLLNGIVSEGIIGQSIGSQHLLFANVYMDAVRDGNSVRYADIGKIVFGEEHNETLTERVIAVKNLLDKAGIPNEVPVNMLREQWNKFMLNVGVNQASAILRAPFGVFQTNDFARDLMVSAAREVMKLSSKCGVSLSEGDLSRFVEVINKLDPLAKTSMLQDIEAGRKSEVEIFAGTVIALGKQHGVPTPVNETFYQIILALEGASALVRGNHDSTLALDDSDT